jgi:hypothetical protein
MSPQIHWAIRSPPPRTSLSMGGADIMGRAAPRAGSAPRSPPLRQTSLLGWPPFDPWEGHRRKACSSMGCIYTALSALMNPLHWRWPLMAMLIHPCSHARQQAWRTAEIHCPRREYPPPVPRVVTNCLECCCGTRVWLQDRLSGVVTNWMQFQIWDTITILLQWL